MTAAAIRRLTLTNFRSYHAASLDVGEQPGRADRPERRRQDQSDRGDLASWCPGRGLRRATLEEVAFAEGDGSWAVSAEVEGVLGLATLGTGIEPPAGGRQRRARGYAGSTASRSARRRPSPTICAWSG